MTKTSIPPFEHTAPLAYALCFLPSSETFLDHLSKRVAVKSMHFSQRLRYKSLSAGKIDPNLSF